MDLGNNRLMQQSLQSFTISNRSQEDPLLISGAYKRSFQLASIFKDSNQLGHRPYKQSLDLLNSHLSANKFHPTYQISPHQFYNEADKIKILGTGKQFINISQVQSDDENSQQQQNNKLETQREFYPDQVDVTKYLPSDLAQIVRQNNIPFQYLYSLANLANQTQIKSLRRRKVQRYLRKRRNKTWNRKICYNCRQKVAQERLRIKGKFIKKKKAKQILGITGYIPTSELKQRLQQQLQGKSASEIEKFIKLQEQSQSQD